MRNVGPIRTIPPPVLPPTPTPSINSRARDKRSISVYVNRKGRRKVRDEFDACKNCASTSRSFLTFRHLRPFPLPEEKSGKSGITQFLSHGLLHNDLENGGGLTRKLFREGEG